jgi:hypothetical protein
MSMGTIRLLACSALTISAFVGCRQTPPGAGAPASAAKPGPQGHEHKAPHGGTLVELGEEFAHVELVRDVAAGTLTAYVLDGEAEQAVRIAQPAIELRIDAPVLRHLEMKGRESALTGERAGDTSEFAAPDDAFKAAGPLRGAIVTIVVKGNTFTNVPFVLSQ